MAEGRRHKPPGGAPASGSWPPFEPGNTASLKHGADSPRRQRAVIEAIRPGLLEAAPWLREEAYTDAVARYLLCEARHRLLSDWITRTVRERGAGHVAAWTWAEANRTAALAATLGSALGLDPAGRAQLLQSAALSHLAHTEAESREIVTERLTSKVRAYRQRALPPPGEEESEARRRAWAQARAEEEAERRQREAAYGQDDEEEPEPEPEAPAQLPLRSPADLSRAARSLNGDWTRPLDRAPGL
jgi:hypothetical protein